MIIPNIIDRNFGCDKLFDIYSKLSSNRIIFINGEINSAVSSLVVSELLYLDSISHDDIFLYINSPGGGLLTV